MDRIHERVAGLDVHRDSVAACVLAPDDRKRPVAHKERFAATAAGLERLAVWLEGWGVTAVAMEATGVYWKCVYYALEDR
ncbi:MAG: transposase, partial [Pseudonocardiaceae bacterium]|nr:transposase [Pseudonocardiaceae bacterium]